MPPGQRRSVTPSPFAASMTSLRKPSASDERAAFLEDAAVDAAAEVLGEVAEDVRVDLADHAVGIDLDARGGGGGARGLGSQRGSGEHGEEGGAQKLQPAMSLHRFNSFS